MDLTVIINFITEVVTSLGLKILISALILVVGLFLVKWVKKFLRESPRLSKVDGGIRSFLASSSSIALYAVLFITIAAILGVPVTSFLTVLASCGVAIGLALQGSLSNFAGGIMILLFKPFKVGDFIETINESGTVKEISVVYTVLTTLDNKQITIPNGTLTNSVIRNYSAEEFRRVVFTFNVGYASDIEKTKEIIYDIVSAHPLALQEPDEPFVRLSGCGQSSLDFTARVWCKNEDYWTIYLDVIEKVKLAFDENGIEIPYPQMDIHVKNDQ